MTAECLADRFHYAFHAIGADPTVLGILVFLLLPTAIFLFLRHSKLAPNTAGLAGVLIFTAGIASYFLLHTLFLHLSEIPVRR